jgi:hypothetical protein
MNHDQLKTSLSQLLEDTLGQVSDTRLNSAIAEAWGDMWVVLPVFDNTSIVFDMSVYQYTLPSTITTLDAIYIKRSANSFPEEIDSGLWEVINGQIIFQKQAPFSIPTGFQLELRGKYKLQTNDTIPTANTALQNYVVNLAAWVILSRMAMTKILSFLHNDTSVSELLAFKTDVNRDVQRYRAQLQQSYVNG